MLLRNQGFPIKQPAGLTGTCFSPSCVEEKQLGLPALVFLRSCVAGKHRPA
jgi:hypothetical protein